MSFYWIQEVVMKQFAPIFLVALSLTFAACNTTPTSQEPSGETVPLEKPPLQDVDLMERQGDGQRVPRFEASEICPFQLPENISPTNVKCGYVVVRESRRPRNQNTIKVAVVVVKNLAGKENSVANVYLQGGPGGDVQGTILGLQGGYLQTFAGQNDFILFDQRGVGKSIPRLECPSSQGAAARVQASISANGGSADPVLDELANQNVAVALKCRDALLAKGYNLGAFNTFENAADVNDIRKALGYKELNLWGGSYGSYLAQIVMRDYRRVIRSVDLEAIIDPRQNWLALSPLAFDRSRLEVFKACAANTACNTAFPNLSTTFDALIADLNATQPEIDIPISATESVRAKINGDLFFNVLNQLLYDPGFLEFVPIYITVTKAGNYRAFASILSQLFLGGDGTNSNGMYYSVVCSDVAQFTNEFQINQILDRVTLTYRRTLGVNALAAFRTCQQWGVRADFFATFPVFSDIPTLLQVGFFDPITPPSYAQAVNRRLFNKQFVFYPAGAHGATRPSQAPGDQNECAQGLLTAFYDDPELDLNDACVKPEITFFVPNPATRASGAESFPIPKIEPAPLLPRY
jgi:pimeloyl-ACP methyl ester carboxylesterase